MMFGSNTYADCSYAGLELYSTVVSALGPGLGTLSPDPNARLAVSANPNAGLSLSAGPNAGLSISQT